MAAGEAQVPVAVFVGELTDFADMIGAQEAGRSRPNGVELLARFSYVLEQARFENFMVFPFPIIFLDYRGKVFL